MATVAIAVGAFVLYLLAYHTYGRYLARRIFRVDASLRAPSEELADGVDYVPSRKELVFGHHFTSIAGTGPIVGPAVAVVWGWLPALLWVLIGSIVMGAVHDFGSLVVSMRHRGRTIADLAGDVVTPRVRLLFLLVVVVGLWIVLAVFGLVIAAIFQLYPSSVAPVLLQIPIAIGLGVWIQRGGSLMLGAAAAVLLMYGTIAVSANFAWAQITLPDAVTGVISPIAFWTLILLAYVFVASVLPVQTLLQPRDFINSWQLLIAMGLLLVGLLISHPPIVADMVNTKPAPATANSVVPGFMPFLFVTIACGAISGFHCLVSSGCSSRQLRTEGDAQYVGYGAMLTEGFLATLVILACVAGIGLGTDAVVPPSGPDLPDEVVRLTGAEAWLVHYGAWGGEAGLGQKLAPFVQGSANMIASIGLSQSLAIAIMGVFVASFAATTLDSATRLQRYVIAELAGGGKKGVPSEVVCASCGYSPAGISKEARRPECGDEGTGGDGGAMTGAGRMPAPPALHGGGSEHHPGGGLPARGTALGAGKMPGPAGAGTGGVGVQLAKLAANRYVATAIAVATAAGLALSDVFTRGLAGAGMGGLILWPIFGATNQLLGGLALLVVTVWLVKQRRPAWVTALPMVFMLAMTGWAIVELISGFARAEGKTHLLAISILMLALEVWIVIEAVILVSRQRGRAALVAAS